MPTASNAVNVLSSFERPDQATLEALIQSPALTKEKRDGLRMYKKMIDPATGGVRVEYTLEYKLANGARGTERKFGRYVGEAKRGNKKTYMCGATMQRCHRNLVFGERYDDVDLVNSAGNVMCQIYVKLGLSVDKMSYLNEHREEVLRMITEHHHLRVDRATAKRTLIDVFNCGSGREALLGELGERATEPLLPPFVEELKQEIRRNLEHIFALPEFSHIKEYVTMRKEDKGERPWIGSFAATLYQDEERRCLEAVVEGVETIARERKVEHPIGSLIHDGLTVRKELEIGRHLARLERAIEAKTGYVLKLELKPMGVTDEERAAYIGDTDRPVELSYEATKARFEASCFKTKRGKFKFHTVDATTGELDSESKEAFTARHEDLRRDGRGFLFEWYGDPDKRSYERIEYSYTKEEDKRSAVYYAFPELHFKKMVSASTEEERQANVRFFLDYLQSLVGGERGHVEWLVMWLADILVNPHDKGKTPIAVILWGEQGSGKSFLREVMARLLGEKLVHHTDDPLRNGDILHDFNPTLKHKLLIEFEEINMKTHSQVADRIKALITDHTHTITHKGHDPVDVRASERALFTTNKPGSVVIEKGDRRYAAFEVSPRRVGDTTYWNEHHRKLRDESYVKDVADYLVSREGELERYSLRDKRPITRYYQSLQHLSLDPTLDFLRDMFACPSFGQEFIARFRSPKAAPGLYAIPSGQLCGEYNRWRAENSLREQISSKSFTMKMVSYGAGYGIQHDTSGNKHNSFLIDSDRLRAALRRDFNMEGHGHTLERYLVPSASEPSGRA
jgi:hypothetical protein